MHIFLSQYFCFQLQISLSAGVQVWPSHTFINHEFQILFISSDTKCVTSFIIRHSLPRVDIKCYQEGFIEIHFFPSLLLLFSRSVSPLLGSLCIENQVAIVSWKLAPISQSGHLCPPDPNKLGTKRRDLINKVTEGNLILSSSRIKCPHWLGSRATKLS